MPVYLFRRLPLHESMYIFVPTCVPVLSLYTRLSFAWSPASFRLFLPLPASPSVYLAACPALPAACVPVWVFWLFAPVSGNESISDGVLRK